MVYEHFCFFIVFLVVFGVMVTFLWFLFVGAAVWSRCAVNFLLIFILFRNYHEQRCTSKSVDNEINIQHCESAASSIIQAVCNSFSEIAFPMQHSQQKVKDGNFLESKL